jgi:hypothetical protein
VRISRVGKRLAFRARIFGAEMLRHQAG